MKHKNTFIMLITIFISMVFIMYTLIRNLYYTFSNSFFIGIIAFILIEAIIVSMQIRDITYAFRLFGIIHIAFTLFLFYQKGYILPTQYSSYDVQALSNMIIPWMLLTTLPSFISIFLIKEQKQYIQE